MKLSVETRTVYGKKTAQLRKESKIPAVIYGRHLAQPLHVTINKVKLLKSYHEAWMSTPVEIFWPDIDQLVLFHHLQVDPVTDHLIHVEFLAVNKDEKVGAEVPVILAGQSIFEKNGLGRVQLLMNTIRVVALPLDLPHDIQVDISHIEHEGQVIHVSDLNLSDKVQIDEDMESAIATSVAYKEEKEEVPAPTAAVEGAQPEGWETPAPAAESKEW